MTSKLEFLLKDAPRCAYLSAYYLAKGPFALSSARAITEVVLRTSRARAAQEFEDFIATEHGRRLANEKSDLAARLDDHESLAKMPEGSLGRLYLDFMKGMMGPHEDPHEDEEVMTDAGGFLSLLRIEEVGEELGWPKEIIWFMRRLTLTHDLTHLFTGYGTDNAGEFANIVYTIGHFDIKALWPIAIGLSLAAKPADLSRKEWMQYLWAAYKRGKSQRASLVHLDYESMLPLQVEEVLRLVGIEAFDQAHPGGQIIDELGFTNLNVQAIMSN